METLLDLYGQNCPLNSKYPQISLLKKKYINILVNCLTCYGPHQELIIIHVCAFSAP